MSRVSAFEALLAGAFCFVAGLAIASGLDPHPGWTHRDVIAIVFGTVLLAEGIRKVRRLYVRQQ